MNKIKLTQSNTFIIVAILFLALAALSWIFYQVPAITIGDQTYVLFIFMPLICLVLGSMFLLFYIDDMSRKKKRSRYTTSKSAIKHYRTIKKLENVSIKRKRAGFVAVGVTVAILSPIIIASGVMGFPLGLPGIYNVYTDPLYNEMVIFVAQDTTDQNLYVFPTYKCTHFTEDFVDSARSEGWRAGYVRLNNPEGAGHAIACFNTKDAGIYFIEPQTDHIFSIDYMRYMVAAGEYSIQGFDMPLDSYTIDWHNPLWV